MADDEKRIEQLETRSAEAALLARLARESATRTYNALQAEDLMALANTLRARQQGLALAARRKNGGLCE
jgi:ABC-type uncharacterized transport system ATPase component